ncbi:Putative permease often clustered with de novo purine synthesis [Candidatus Sumerlaea chitinivorans]|uniref:Permease often clustered with de novo purine synthesis n=1 Tax=Sumerlaea chitinivorans TaxID=2250252 RepID=A0A2Z4Y369_SUMC1|nr:Putative permease often clustered with de novo purine synthesis [Candidatus Sumerlaea chitinivorans]
MQEHNTMNSTPPPAGWRGDRILRRALLALLILLDVGLVLALLAYLKPVIVWSLNVLSPFFVALLVAYIFNPFVSMIQRQFRLARTAAVTVGYAIILSVTVTVFAVLLPIVYVQLRTGVHNLVQATPMAIAAISERLQLQVSQEDIARLQEALAGRLDLDRMVNEAGPTLKGLFREVVATASSLTRLAVDAIKYSLGFIAFSVFVAMITFYFLVDFGRIGPIMAILVPPQHRERVFSLWKEMDRALGGFLRGQLTVCVIIGVLYSIALMLLGMKHYAILIGFLAGFGNLIPYAGPVLGAVPTMLWIVFGPAYPDLNAKLMGIGAVILVSIAIQSLDGFFLQPRIVGKGAGLHPVLVLIALVIGSQFGLGGLILAVPCAIVARVLMRELWWRPLAERRRRQALETASTSSQ